MNPAAQVLMSALKSTAAAGEKMPGSRDAEVAGADNSATSDGLKLLRAFLNIRDAALRRSVVHLVELLAGPQAKS